MSQRVAQLAEQLKLTPVCEYEAFLAAALAACAREVLREVNADAEADMLKGNPITGAHHRAIERKVAALERAAGERAGDLRVKS